MVLDFSVKGGPATCSDVVRPAKFGGYSWFLDASSCCLLLAESGTMSWRLQSFVVSVSDCANLCKGTPAGDACSQPERVDPCI